MDSRQKHQIYLYVDGFLDWNQRMTPITAFREADEVRYISSCIVRPTRHNDESTHRIELTPWDIPLLQAEYIQTGLLFHKPAPNKEVNLIQQLTASLSFTLNIFYPLAGRLSLVENQDNTACLFINCNGVGAHFVYAAADGVRVSDIIDPVYIPDDIMHNFFSMNSVRNYEGISKPLLSVQVTELVDGIFIGCSVNHAVIDGTSFWRFFNTWSELFRSGFDYDKVASHINTPVFGPRNLPVSIPLSQIQILEKLIHHKPASSSTLSHRVFHFPKAKVAQLKAKANAEMGTHNISSLQALVAHLWRATTRARQGLKSEEETTYRIVVGLRQRLKPPLPDHYMGNAILIVQVKSTVSDLLQHGPGWAALRINKAIAAVTPEYVTEEMEHRMKAAVVPLNVSTSVHTLITNGSTRFNVYGVDFGWGRPLAARGGAANTSDGTLRVFPGAEEGSVDFYACLLTETYESMTDDAEFMEAVLI